MFKDIIMQRNAAVITAVCLLLCLTFNYTFPLHRDSTKWSPISFHNHSKTCDAVQRHASVQAPSNNIKEVKKSESKSIYSADRPMFNENDLRQFEQLVIMKKYPYLDHKELEIRFSSPGKNVRQSEKYHSENIAGESSIREPIEDGLNVEIINRGLSGFAIPSKISRDFSNVENKLENGDKEVADTESKIKPPKIVLNQDMLGSLHNDVKEYTERKRYEINIK